MAQNGELLEKLEKETDGEVTIFRKKSSVTEVTYVPKIHSIHESVDVEKPEISSESTVVGRGSAFLYISVLIVSFLAFSCGSGLSWTSPVIPKLNSTESPLNAPITSVQVGWIVAILSIGHIVGPFFYGYFADKIGRKRTLIFGSLPIIFALGILAFARDVRLYYVARFLHGFGIGGTFAVQPNYLAEISLPQNRGLLSTLSSLFMVLGASSSYAIGPFVSIKQLCLITVAPAIIFLIFFSIFVPDSPVFLIMSKKESKAIEALRKIRNSDEKELEFEISKIKEFVAASHSGKAVGILYLVKNCKKAFRIGVVLSLAPPLVGLVVYLSFLEVIFRSAGKAINPKSASLAIGVMKVFTMMITSAVIERVGRRTLLLLSASGLCFSNFSLGMFFYVKIYYPRSLEYVWWLPLACVMLYFVFLNAGLSTVNMVYQTEIFPSSVRSLAGAFNATLGFSFGFIVAFLFPVMSEYGGLYSPFFMFAGLSALIAIFVYFYLPETRGKTLIEIQELLQ